MQFLGISLPEAALIAVVALVVLGPRGMSSVARTLVQWRQRLETVRAQMAGEMSEYTQEFAEQTGWNDAANAGRSMREEAQRTLSTFLEADGGARGRADTDDVDQDEIRTCDAVDAEQAGDDAMHVNVDTASETSDNAGRP